MSVPVLTFFNNKGGVGKTSLVYHLSWMLSKMGKRVVAIDLDPQANLTSAFLPDEQLEDLWDGDLNAQSNRTIYQCIKPLTRVGDILAPQTETINQNLFLVPGDLALAGFEDTLSTEWPLALGSGEMYRPFRILTAFWQVAQMAAKEREANIILADVGPHLGAINRSALIASDYIIIPLGADLFSLQGLRNLGPTLQNWRKDWKQRTDHWKKPEFSLPTGRMLPLGYTIMAHNEKASRIVKSYKKWADRIPTTYSESIQSDATIDYKHNNMDSCLATLKHYRSLMPMAHEARKPIFDLTTADGAIGNHSSGVKQAYVDFNGLAKSILNRISLETMMS